MTINPRVSIVMPVFNAGRFLEASVQSMLDQSFKDFEFLIFDDESDDGSRERLEEFAAHDSRVRLTKGRHSGYVNWLIEGVKTAHGDLVTRMDADDVSMPHRLQRQVDYLDENPDCVVVGCWADLIDLDDEVLATKRLPTTHVDIDEQHLRGQGGAVFHPAATMRRDAIVRVGGYRREFELAEDFDLFLRLSEVGCLANLPEVLLQYRMHPKSVSIERRNEQLRRARQALFEAHQRRGTDPVNTDEVRVFPSPTVLEVHRDWAELALSDSRPGVACKHAWIAASGDLWAIKSWQVLADAIRSARRDLNPGECPDALPLRSSVVRVAVTIWSMLLSLVGGVALRLRGAALRVPIIWRWVR